MQKEGKKGNDQADVGAERGAVAMQRVTHEVADTYSWMHGGYRNLMVRIQKFIVGLRNMTESCGEKQRRK